MTLNHHSVGCHFLAMFNESYIQAG